MKTDLQSQYVEGKDRRIESFRPASVLRPKGFWVVGTEYAQNPGCIPLLQRHNQEICKQMRSQVAIVWENKCERVIEKLSARNYLLGSTLPVKQVSFC